MDLHTRRLRLALLVAQERNVTRAAARVHLSQQALSQQIAALEKDLGFQVFVRSSRGVDVTPAGRTMLAAAHGVLETLDDAYRTARRAVDPARLSVGFLVGGLAELTPVVLDALADTDPATELELVEHPLSDPAAGLRTGQSDVALLRPPLDETGLEILPLASEPRVVALSAGDPLAGQQHVRCSELAGRELVGVVSGDAAFQAFWELRDGSVPGPPPTILRRATTVPEELQLVAAGRAVSVTAASASRYLPWPGVVFRTLIDAAPSVLAVGVRSDAPAARTRPCLQRVRTAVRRRSDVVDQVAAGLSGR